MVCRTSVSARVMPLMPTIASIGYEHATPAALIAELRRAGVGLLVDVRAVPNSRRPGFSKKALGAALDEAGIGYLHLRALGTPADGRAAARSGKHAEMHRIFRKQLETPEAQDALEMLEGLVAEAAAHGLEHWEPELAARTYEMLLKARVGTGGKGNSQPPDQEVFDRLCRLDPAAAFKVAP